jgi:TatD DNase family protein
MIDTHCHIDEEAFDADREEVIARQRAAGVEAMIVPGVNGESIETVMRVCRAHPGYCYPALGLHPEDVKADWQERLEEIKQAIRNYQDELVAVGEIGLDYYWDKTYKAAQQEVLRQQIALARELDLPVILHNREATEDLLRILENAQGTTDVHNTKVRGVFHCFNGSKETAQRILKTGMYIGIGGVLTFKNCKLYETLEVVPLERILLETDAPYMAPTPHRGERNESRLMIHVAEQLADIFGRSPEEIIRQTTANAKQLFSIEK